jgi:DNA invertase Pin-like site-specific DNA recombinase
MENAVIYARYSSAGQTEQSIEGQLRVCKEYAERTGYTVTNEYIDRATTGTNDNRPAFRQMLDDAKRKEFSAVIVYKLDRFSRNKYDSVIHKHNLKKLEVKILSATEMLSDTAEGRLLESILESMAEMYSEDLSQKVRRGVRESLMKGNFIGGIVLYGYKVVDKKIVIDDERAKAVRYLFSEYAKGKPKKQIMQEMNDKGWRSTNGKKFTKNSFQSALSNRKYIGEYNIHDIESESYPAIIDRDTFDRVQIILQTHKHAPATQKAKEEYFLTGTAICGHCGSDMVGVSGTSKTKGKRHNYYVCSKRWRHKDCDKSHEPKIPLENYVFEYVLDFISQPDQLVFIADSVLEQYESSFNNQAIKDLERRIAKLDTELDKCFDMMLSAETDEIRKRADQKAKDIEIQKKDLQAELGKLNAVQKLRHKTREDIIDYIQFMIGTQDFGTERRRRIINTFVSVVVVTDVETFVGIDADGYDKHFDGKEWFDDIDWGEAMSSEAPYDKNGVLILNAPPRQSG